MSVEQPDRVDVISTDKQTGHVVLTISDHLDWSDSTNHQTILQAKLNRYLAFVESGEIFTRYRDAKSWSGLNLNTTYFLAKAKVVIESAGLSLRHEIFAESCDT